MRIQVFNVPKESPFIVHVFTQVEKDPCVYTLQQLEAGFGAIERTIAYDALKELEFRMWKEEVLKKYHEHVKKHKMMVGSAHSCRVHQCPRQKHKDGLFCKEHVGVKSLLPKKTLRQMASNEFMRVFVE